MRVLLGFLFVLCPFVICSCGLKGPLYLPVERVNEDGQKIQNKVMLVNQTDIDTDTPLSADQLIQSNEPMVIEKESKENNKTESIRIESNEIVVK